MEIVNIEQQTNKMSIEELKSILPELPTTIKLLNILAEYNINVACTIKDKFNRKIIVTSYGVAQCDDFDSVESANLDRCDGGIVSSGLYDGNCTLLNYKYNFDFIVEYKTGLITCGENMIGYIIVDNEPLGLRFAVNNNMDEIFEEEFSKIPKKDLKYIPATIIKEE